MAALDPMPADGPPGLFASLPYLIQVLKARSQRATVMRSFRRELAAEQRRLDNLVRDLGQRARQLTLSHPALDGLMHELAVLEEQRGELEATSKALAAQLDQAQVDFDAAAQKLRERIAAAQQEMQDTHGALTDKNNEMGRLKARLGQIDRDTGKLNRTLRSKHAEAAKTQDAARQQTLEQEIADASGRISELEQERNGLEAARAALEAPLAQLNSRLAEIRSQLLEAQRELATARQELASTKRTLSLEIQRKGQDLARQDNEIAAKHLDIGRAIEEGGVRDPALEELLRQVRENKEAIQTRETCVATLAAEQDAYDHQTAKKGAILAASIGGGAVLLVLVLVLAL